ncbi:MAG TPA: serine/threonine-protein kinase [Burkholderiales bacterium]
MRKAGFYKRDWFIALLVAAAFAAARYADNPWLERLELLAYDLGVRATYRLPGAAEDIALVAIDEPSLAALGPWPWPRSVLADGLERLKASRPRAVGVLLDWSEPEADRGLAAVRDIRERFAAMSFPRAAQPQARELGRLLAQAERALDGDRALARALRGVPRLHLPLHAAGHGDAPAAAVRAPLPEFAAHATLGHLAYRADADGGRRALRAVLAGDDARYALPILLAAASVGLDRRHLVLEPGRRLALGRLQVPLDRTGHMHPGFHAPRAPDTAAFATYSFSDVHAGKVPNGAFANKVVLLGLAAGVGPAFPTPVAPAASEIEVAANAIAAILNQDFYTIPEWSLAAEAAAALAVLLYLLLALPHLRGGTAALVTLLLLLALLGAGQFLMATQKLWLATTSPALLLLAGHFAIGAKRLVLGERRRLEAAADAAHTNRMLGLSFQSQGQLDLAMDKFRALPVDASVLELIYNLALDFERKRQFHKAAAAYDYILAHDARFRDAAERKKRAEQGDHTIALGKTLILHGAEKPTLGRYQIEREIGRGAMGVVYLGLDPKINRRVAIKTLALSEEFEAKELEAVRERFFREAETAGRLHHPNIVTIYDVGEDHDLAYIAMEYLEGKGLDAYINPDKPLPFDRILDIAIKVADALAYAHRQDVVHRDIKPHNIIYHEPSGSVKVMDFGIARLTDSSRTRTGLVLGTPAYMSPEQVSGKRVDGRSDLYSLGVTLFEMVTGDTPFDGDSFAALMHQITTATAPDLRKLRSETPASLAAIVKRLLQKPVTKRYQNGEELKRDLEACRAQLGEAARA